MATACDTHLRAVRVAVLSMPCAHGSRKGRVIGLGWCPEPRVVLCIAPEVPVGLQPHCVPPPVQVVPAWMLPETRTEVEPICLYCPTTTGFLPQPCVSVVFVGMISSPV